MSVPLNPSTNWADVKITVIDHTPIQHIRYRVIDGVPYCTESCTLCDGEPMTQVGEGVWQCVVGAQITKMLGDAARRLNDMVPVEPVIES